MEKINNIADRLKQFSPKEIPKKNEEQKLNDDHKDANKKLLELTNNLLKLQKIDSIQCEKNIIKKLCIYNKITE